MQLVETVRELGTALPSEARNVFLRTPEGLETPHFRLLHEGDGVRGCGYFCHVCDGGRGLGKRK